MKRNKFFLFFTVLFMVLSTIAVSGQFKSLDQQKNAFNNFKKEHGKAEAKWNINTGIAASVFKIKAKITDQDLEKGVKNFLVKNKEMLGLTKIINDLEVDTIKVLNNITSVRLVQKYKKVPVENSEYHIYLDDQKNIVMLNGNLIPDLQLDIKEVYSETEALQLAENFMADKCELKGIKSFGKVILEYDNVNYLAWKFHISFRPQDAFDLYIDAKENYIIKYESTFMRNPPPLTNLANIYTTNPSNGLSYDVSVYNLDNSYYLRGDYVTNVIGFDGNETYSFANDFRLTPSVDEFDEANVYWHIDRIASVYFENLNIAPPSVGVTLLNNTSGGAFDDDNYVIYFGRGDTNASNPTNKPTRSNDDIYHEYSHAVIDQLGLGSAWGETRAKNEAYADYFTACYTGDPEIMEWYFINYDHATSLSTSPSQFNYENFNTVSYNFMQPGQPHVQGMIWSGALWDLRQSLGSGITDLLVSVGISYSQGNTNYEDGKNSIIQVDNLLYGGSHEQTIRNIFQARGIGTPSAPQSFTVSGNVGEHPYLTWQSHSAPDIAGYRIYQSLNGGSYNLYTTLNSDITSFTDNGVTISGNQSDPIVCYKVTAFDIYNQESDYSSADCVKSDQISKSLAENKISLEEFDTIVYNPFPNPFNSATNIKMKLIEDSEVTLKIFNILGELVGTDNYFLSKGINQIKISNNSFVSGIYYYSLYIKGQNDFIKQTGKFIYSK